MILLIDGYNVVKQAMMKSQITDRERDSFIAQLGKYCKIKGHKAKLVFDGGTSNRSTRECVHGIDVIYSGYKNSADDYIKDYLDEHRVLDVLLVSSDRDICRHASRVNVEQLDAKDFYYIMCNALNALENSEVASSKMVSSNMAIKTSTSKNSELDYLMQEGSRIVKKKQEDIEVKDYFAGIKQNKLAKKDAQKLKKIKKL